MALSSRAVDSAKPGKYLDGEVTGLMLVVSSSGARRWILRFMIGGKARELGLGTARGDNLKAARDSAREARNLIANGIDPIEARHKAEAISSAPAFGSYALQLVDRIKTGFRNPKHRAQWRSTLETYCPPIWGTAIDNVDVAGVMACLQPIWQTKPETASRVRGRIERVLDSAKAEGLRSGENPAILKGNLALLLPKRSKLAQGHHAALPYADIPVFISDLRGREGLSALALEFAIFTCARTGEALGATWAEFDFEAALWTVPANRMKAGREHRVPLSGPALAILHKLQEGRMGDYIFPASKPNKPLSGMAMLMLLRRMGKTDITAHGFRSSFSDWASEVSHYSSELRESALAHTIGNKAEAAYRRGDALEKRRAMMQAWAVWCEPREGANVVALRKGA